MTPWAAIKASPLFLQQRTSRLSSSRQTGTKCPIFFTLLWLYGEKIKTDKNTLFFLTLNSSDIHHLSASGCELLPKEISKNRSKCLRSKKRCFFFKGWRLSDCCCSLMEGRLSSSEPRLGSIRNLWTEQKL